MRSRHAHVALIVILSRTFPTSTPQYVAFVRIVPGAFLFVGEDFVCRLDVSKEGSSALCVAMVAVRMELECFLAICLFESGVC
jgi:hypothetical protein